MIQELSVLTNELSKSIATIKKIVVKFSLQGGRVCLVKNTMVFFEGTVIKEVMITKELLHFTVMYIKELSLLR